MEIRINGSLAVLKKNTSFDFISENRLFTGSDSYTLTITFPLKGCQQNIAIFRHIHRADVEKDKVVFDCDIRHGTFFKSGVITVTEISETEVKTQFLEGRSKQNFEDSFDDIYLNQLDLGYPSAEERKAENVDVNTCYKKYPNADYLPLPWVNNTSGNLQNQITLDTTTGKYAWKSASTTLSYQPYLLHILYKICEAVGYTGDFSAIEQTKYAQLLICNTLPAAWQAWNFAIALPHWSLTEFFEELENFLFGEFSIDHKAKKISFSFSSDTVAAAGEVLLDKVVDAYTVEVTEEDDSQYLATSNIKYADNDNRFWAYRDCAWYIRQNKDKAVVYDTLRELAQFAETLKTSGYVKESKGHGYRESFFVGYATGSDGHKLYYAKDVDTYFIMFCYKTELIKTIKMNDDSHDCYLYYYRLEPINQFGERFISDDAEELELKVVPAWIDDTNEEIGQVLFLECGDMGTSDGWVLNTDANGNIESSSGFNTPTFGSRSGDGKARVYDTTDYSDGAVCQSNAGKAIEKGEQDQANDYFDCIYVGFWRTRDVAGRTGLNPRPTIDIVETYDDFTFKYSKAYSLRLDGTGGEDHRQFSHEIDPKKKYTFSFLANTIPDPRALFYIRGGRYICEKLTATFNDQGMSEKIKGVFYRVKD